MCVSLMSVSVMCECGCVFSLMSVSVMCECGCVFHSCLYQ